MTMSNRLLHSIVDQPEQGIFNVHRDLFRDADIFDLEMARIFEGSWIFVGLESQIPKPHDYLTNRIGRVPVVISRDAAGKLHGLLNSCRHRGATVFTAPFGNRKYHACPYHGWTYDSRGHCVDVKDIDSGAYPDGFAAESHDLVEIPRLDSYRGFIFASLNAQVPSLQEHLGGASKFLDLVVDQGPEGVETIPGSVTYTYKGNWKMQVENALDLYHFTSTHPSYIDILRDRREYRKKQNLAGAGSIYEDMAAQQQSQRGSFSFPYGHVAYWGENPNINERPLADAISEVRQRVGELTADWMLKVRNLVIYPNLQIVENASLQLRVLQPLAVDKTEVTAYCLGPRGESPAARERRIRQYEDFYNPTGFATPDDVAVYEACQRGHQASSLEWQQGYLRGMTARKNSGNDASIELGLEPNETVVGGYDLADETCFHAGYREWHRLMLGAHDTAAPVAPGGSS